MSCVKPYLHHLKKKLNMKKAVLAVAAILFTVASFAQPHRRYHRPMRRHHHHTVVVVHHRP
jgi:hypothetical protein